MLPILRRESGSTNDLAACYPDHGINVETGQFGADMSVHLVNDGPVTIWLDTEAR